MGSAALAVEDVGSAHSSGRCAYEVSGRRIAKRVYSSATGGTVAYTRFVYHGSQVAFETDSTGAIGLRYTWGLEVDDLVGVCTAPCNTEANHYYATVDQLRNVREVTRRDGTWLLSRRFGPYGAQIEEAGAVSFELRYRWTGREYDAETGFYLFRSRYYDVAARRFVQEDPIGYSGGASLYQYGEGNPLNGRDPDGLGHWTTSWLSFNFSCRPARLRSHCLREQSPTPPPLLRLPPSLPESQPGAC